MKESDDKLECWAFAGWDTNYFYTRRGASKTLFFGTGAWMDAWYRRLVAPKTVRQLADSGITLVFTHFYKGYGIKFESQFWPVLKKYVATCHQHGIKVWGYLQGQSLFYETMLEEVPTLRGWLCHGYDRKPGSWENAYYRWPVCLTSPGFREYMRRVIRIGLKEIGLDGIHNDNSYYNHCYCDRCVRLFRKWLEARPKMLERIGLPSAKHILPPPLKGTLGAITDPLQIAWMEFGTRQRLETFRCFYETIKACKPSAGYDTNPGVPRWRPLKSRLAFDPAREVQICNVLCAEGSNVPRVDDKKIVHSQIEPYLMADAAGYQVWNTSWVTMNGKALTPGTPGAIWSGLAEEFSFHAAWLGNNWILRSTGDRDGMCLDKPCLRAATAEALRWFSELHRAQKMARRRQWGEVGLYVEPDTLTLRGDTDLPGMRGMLYWLMGQRIPPLLVFAGQKVPDCVKTLVVCWQSCLADCRLKELAAFARKTGRRVVIVGASGLYDEWSVPRNRSAWQAWRKSPGFVADNGKVDNWFEPINFTEVDAPTAVRPTPQGAAGFKRLLAEANPRPEFVAILPGYALVNAESSADGRFFIHLREQSGTDKAVTGARLRLSARLAAGKKITMHAPGQTARPLAQKTSGATVIIHVPKFRRYALIVISEK